MLTNGWCVICGEPTEFLKRGGGYKKTCSKKCLSDLISANSTKNNKKSYFGRTYSGKIMIRKD